MKILLAVALLALTFALGLSVGYWTAHTRAARDDERTVAIK